ncbi:F-box/kelch-repeat protein [Panicum miliaceum]|uniref:F-box/kelch-repeat protein n=1 Tax=Panicum miliaceum TaxID=4540 RepID=A0A3L6RJ18_PANMI|nr:F-box/kelch-repeat protein [Panicum miliaceum]
MRNPEWKDLPEELVAVIAKRLPCDVDRNSLFAACRLWSLAASQPRVGVQAPWLMLPRRTGHVGKISRRPEFFCVIGKDHHNIRIPKEAEHCRLFGSCAGGWIFAACGQFMSQCLLNIRTHESVKLPDYLRWPRTTGSFYSK